MSLQMKSVGEVMGIEIIPRGSAQGYSISRDKNEMEATVRIY